MLFLCRLNVLLSALVVIMDLVLWEDMGYKAVAAMCGELRSNGWSMIVLLPVPIAILLMLYLHVVEPLENSSFLLDTESSDSVYWITTHSFYLFCLYHWVPFRSFLLFSFFSSNLHLYSLTFETSFPTSLNLYVYFSLFI